MSRNKRIKHITQMFYWVVILGVLIHMGGVLLQTAREAQLH